MKPLLASSQERRDGHAIQALAVKIIKSKWTEPFMHKLLHHCPLKQLPAILFYFPGFFIHLGIDVVVGLYFLLRPYQLFRIIELFTEHHGETRDANGAAGKESDAS